MWALETRPVKGGPQSPSVSRGFRFGTSFRHNDIDSFCFIYYPFQRRSSVFYTNYVYRRREGREAERGGRGERDMREGRGTER